MGPGQSVIKSKEAWCFFEETSSVFYDEFAVQFYDDANSDKEQRFLMLGFSDGARLLVCHCEREQGNVIRIISARKATMKGHNFILEWGHED